MPSPFPGMDPFLEGSPMWSDFHGDFLYAVREALVPKVRPKYIVLAQVQVVVMQEPSEKIGTIVPDVVVVEGESPLLPEHKSEIAVAVTAPATVRLAFTQKQEQVYLEIRERETRKLVTVIELLSPSNKRFGSPAWGDYLKKRDSIFASDVHLVELDLLRGGTRMPMGDPLPSGDYYAIISRSYRRPYCEVYAWTLRDRMPTIPIPLLRGDPDVDLDLQRVFNTVYERAGYDYSLDYS
ncbi:MAG: DUF4058 family protein, partial [Armatimonadota bacterium]|nr:DUF4058 family protein [Armatimonadota bacterium]MDW8143726.1 DUF4058 family protein [Armatimonadota bacterium]